jgi:hypothetical protein
MRGPIKKTCSSSDMHRRNINVTLLEINSEVTFGVFFNLCPPQHHEHFAHVATDSENYLSGLL